MKLSEMQKAIYQNKIDHQFNVTNIEKEFLALYGEIGEAFDAYRKQQEVGEELADVAIYLLGLAEILSIDLEAEIHKKNGRQPKAPLYQLWQWLCKTNR